MVEPPHSLRLQPLLEDLFIKLRDDGSELSEYLDNRIGRPPKVKVGKPEPTPIHQCRQKNWASRFRILFFDIVIRNDAPVRQPAHYLERCFHVQGRDPTRYADSQELSEMDESALKEGDVDVETAKKYYEKFQRFVEEHGGVSGLVVDLGAWLRCGNQTVAHMYRKWWEVHRNRFSEPGSLSKYTTDKNNYNWYRIMVIDKENGLHSEPKHPVLWEGIQGRGNGWRRGGWAIAIAQFPEEIYGGLRTSPDNQEYADMILQKFPTYESAIERFDIIVRNYRPEPAGPTSSSENVSHGTCREPGCGGKMLYDFLKVTRYCEVCGDSHIVWSSSPGTLSEPSASTGHLDEGINIQRLLKKHWRMDWPRWRINLNEGFREYQMATGLPWKTVTKQVDWVQENIRRAKRKD